MGFAACVVACGKPSRTSGEAHQGVARADSASIPTPQPQNPVLTVVLPHDEPLLPPGPGREEFVTACTVCHSPRYITMQPRFSRSAWLSEVKKMKDTYGAHISDEQVPKLTDYLMFLDGKAEDRRTSPNDIHGSDIHGTVTYGE
jgi:hypothetical protein